MCAVSQVPVLFLSGPPGVGKTTVGEMFDQLIRQGYRPALVDVDLLGACWPVPDDDPYNDRLKALNLGSSRHNFHTAGARCLIATGVVEAAATVRLYASAVPGAVSTVCRLRAGHDELRARIVRRGRERGDEVERLSQRAIYLAGKLERNDVADFCVDADEHDVVEIAQRALAQAGGWPRNPGASSST